MHIFSCQNARFNSIIIEKLNNKLHGLSPPGGFVSPSGGFASLSFDQSVPKNSQPYLANRNATCILHWSDWAYLCCLLSQLGHLKVLTFPFFRLNWYASFWETNSNLIQIKPNAETTIAYLYFPFGWTLCFLNSSKRNVTRPKPTP